MRALLACPLLLFACRGPEARTSLPSGFSPQVPLVVALPPGTPVCAEVLGPLPDEPPYRAARVWWREALRQTVWFELHETADAPTGEIESPATVQLSLDPGSRTVAAFLLRDGRQSALAGDSFSDGDLPAAIDRLAWSARTALGEPIGTAAPVATAACMSADPTVTLTIADALELLRLGAATGAHQALLAARRRDGAAPAVLDCLATIELLRGNADKAEALCGEALGYEHRLAPTTLHRLTRTLLLARASLRPERAEQHDRELLALATAGRRERPHDLQIALSEALAHNFLGAFATSRPLLESLHRKEPDHPIVAYHLGWACLGTGDGPGAELHFAAAALRLPMPWVAVPRAIACFAAGHTEELGRLLEQFQAEVANDGDPVVHEIRRMQAAHAVLTGADDQAKRHILLDLQWLLRHPTVLERRAGEFAEQAAVLVRLGGGDAELPTLLAAIQGQHPSTVVADACAYVSGLVTVRRTGARATVLEERLGRGGESPWSSLLAAFAHEVRGEVQDMHTALVRAARLTDSPMTKALLARSLRAGGRVEQATHLQAALRRELLAIHLRRIPQHPVLGPELAFAFQAD